MVLVGGISDTPAPPREGLAINRRRIRLAGAALVVLCVVFIVLSVKKGGAWLAEQAEFFREGEGKPKRLTELITGIFGVADLYYAT